MALTLHVVQQNQQGEAEGQFEPRQVGQGQFDQNAGVFSLLWDEGWKTVYHATLGLFGARKLRHIA